MASSNRIESIDGIKGFAIYLVVLGHFLQSTSFNYDENHLFRIIYSFHMPLFIFVSGYLSYREKGLPKDFLKKRIISLLIPYLVWLVIIALFNFWIDKKDMLSFVYNAFWYPDNGLWFLWVLFWMQMLLYIYERLFRFIDPILLFILWIVIMSIVFYSGIDNILSVKSFAVLFFYFILGFSLNKYKLTFSRLFSKWFLFLPIFLFLAYFWSRGDALTIINLSIQNIFLVFGLKILTACLGILSIFGFFFKQISVNSVIINFGRDSIIIYSMNVIILKLLNLYLPHFYEYKVFYYLKAFTISFIVTAICYMLGLIFKKNKLLSFLFLGKILNK